MDISERNSGFHQYQDCCLRHKLEPAKRAVHDRDALQFPVEVDDGSEFRYRDPIIDIENADDLHSAIRETADTLARAARGQSKARKLYLCSVFGSLSARGCGTDSDPAGPRSAWRPPRLH